jgi:hypothetical protein
MSPSGQGRFARPACRRVRGGATQRVSGMLAVVATIGTLSASLAEAQRPASPTPAASPLWISDTPLEDGKRLLIVIDPTTRHAAVYQVDPVTGGMVLKSTRDISWDLRLDEFNAQEPKPATLRKMLEPAGRP